MAMIEIDSDEVVVRLSGWEKVGAFHGDLRFPRSAIRVVRTVENPFAELRGIRAPGTGFPRLIALGTWRRRGAKDFAAVYGRGRGVAIDLAEGQPYRRVVVSSDDPERVCSLLS